MRCNVILLFTLSFLFSSFDCGLSLIPIEHRVFEKRDFYREEKCLGSEVGDIIQFIIDNDFDSATPNVSQDFHLAYKDTVSKSCFFVHVDNDVNELIIENFIDSFLFSTPNSDFGYTQGIKNSEESLFGLPPVINDISEVNILFYDFNNQNIRGYFTGNDQIDCSNYNCSNIIYINADSYLNNNISRGLFTLAHEYQHLLHWNSDINEGNFINNDGSWYLTSPWLNEGLSDLAPSILGLGQRLFSPYLDNIYLTLDEWPVPGSNIDKSPYYAKSALFFQYIFEFYNSPEIPLINIIFNNQFQGVQSMINTFELIDKSFDEVFSDWIIKNIVDGYETVDEILIVNSNLELNLNNQNSIVYFNTIENFKRYSSYLISVSINKNLIIDSLGLAVNNNYIKLIDGKFGDISNIDYSTNNIVYNDIMLSITSNNRVFDTDVNADIYFSYIPQKLTIFPNPLINSSRLHFDLYDSFINDEIEISIFNISGRIIENIFLSSNRYIENYNTFVIDKSKYSSGYYFIKINNSVQSVLIIK